MLVFHERTRAVMKPTDTSGDQMIKQIIQREQTISSD